MNLDSRFWKDRRVLITGHTGFKGAWLTLWLSRLGASVTGLALPPMTDPNLFSLALRPHHVTSVFGDIRDLPAVLDCFATAQPEIVFHMAAQALVRPSYQDPIGTYATNVMGTAHVLEAIRATTSVDAVVVVTSDKCYQNREWYWSYREDEPMGGHDPYSSSKGCAELVAAAYRSSFFAENAQRRCRIATARAGNVIGGGDWSADRLVPDLIRSFIGRASAEIRSPAAVRPWQHVLEPLCAYIALAEHIASDKGDEYAEAWNFGPAEEDCRPVAYLADRLTSSWGGGAGWHRSDKVHPPEATFLKVDASKARARLGWKPRMRLETALDWTAQWYRRQADGANAEVITMEQIAAYEASAESAS